MNCSAGKVLPVNATTLGAGMLLTGLTLTITTQMLYDFGLDIGIWNDKKRQVLLNLVCWFGAVVIMIAYPYNQTKENPWVGDWIGTPMFWIIAQYGLVILNHNTLTRIGVIMNLSDAGRARLNKIGTVFYFLPPIVMIPIWLAMRDFAGTTNPSTGIPFGPGFHRYYNSEVYKPLNTALVISTEALAIITDIILLKKVFDASRASKAFKNQSVSWFSGEFKDLMVMYSFTWGMIIFDCVIKLLIAAGHAFFFDTVITITCIALRSRANLLYGLEIKSLISNDSTTTQKTTNNASSVSHKPSVVSSNISSVQSESLSMA